MNHHSNQQQFWKTLRFDILEKNAFVAPLGREHKVPNPLLRGIQCYRRSRNVIYFIRVIKKRAGNVCLFHDIWSKT
jgi:hypothetical protein